MSQWCKERRKQDSNKDRSNSALGEPVIDRRGSLMSVAVSESSRSDLVTRAGRKGEDGDRGSNFQVINQPKNYFKSVSENKEIAKLVSLLSTSINSTKKVMGVSYRAYL